MNMSVRRKIVIIAALGICVLVAVIVIGLLSAPPQFVFTTDYTVSDQCRLTAGLVHGHPFLAEYHKYVVVKSPHKEYTFYVGLDSGGMTAINLYRHQGEYVVVSEEGKWHCIDPVTGAVVEKSRTKDRDAPDDYVGRFDFVERRQWDFIPATPGEYRAPEYW